MVSRTEALLSWLAFPIYVWQGLGVRRRTVRMLPPPSNGYVKLPGKGKELNILIVGDSTAAGIGVETIEQSLGGQAAEYLNKQTGRPVNVRIAGNSSAVSSQIRDYVVPHLDADEYDYISLCIGTNDAKNFHRGNRFCRDFGTLLYALKAKYPTSKIIWTGIIDMAGVPALPSPLNKILSIRSRILNRNGRILCEERGVLAPVSKWKVIDENFAPDQFHPGEAGYKTWAKDLTDYILELESKH